MADRLDSSGRSGPKELGAGQELLSPNRAYSLALQADGNLVGYDVSLESRPPFWSSETSSDNWRDRYRLVMQTDGNAVIYDSKNMPCWSTRTDEGEDAPYVLVMQDDRNIVLRDKNLAAVWASDTDTSVKPGSKRYHLGNVRPPPDNKKFKATTYGDQGPAKAGDQRCKPPPVISSENWPQHMLSDPYWQAGTAAVGGTIGLVVGAVVLPEYPAVKYGLGAAGAVGAAFAEYQLSTVAESYSEAVKDRRTYKSLWFSALPVAVMDFFDPPPDCDNE